MLKVSADLGGSPSNTDSINVQGDVRISTITPEGDVYLADVVCSPILRSRKNPSLTERRLDRRRFMVRLFIDLAV